MKTLRILGNVLVMLLITATTLTAQSDVRIGKKTYLSTCSSVNIGSVYFVTNAAAAGECVSTGAAGLFHASCQCGWNGSSYAWGSIAAEEVDLSAYVLLAGDADGQVIQGISGSDQARVDIGVTDTTSARLLGSGATPAYVYADNQYAGMGSFGGTSSINVSDAAIGMNASSGTASINFGTVNSWIDLTETYFEFGVGAVSLNISETAFRVVYGQTPPTNANDACTTGDTIDTATFHYYCAATNTWVRVAMATWP